MRIPILVAALATMACTTPPERVERAAADSLSAPQIRARWYQRAAAPAPSAAPEAQERAAFAKAGSVPIPRTSSSSDMVIRSGQTRYRPVRSCSG